ncbi:hypothetical protein Leryth_008732 [Lithospermum erythrorhizon]|nr:hypothetical protein Leryth_008732 [Lithospermum erythrorhizon]
MQPITLTPESVKPRRKNVRYQRTSSVAARHRRRIRERMRYFRDLFQVEQKWTLLPSMLDEAIHYVKFLKNPKCNHLSMAFQAAGELSALWV